jgi:SAM-dependent methyltransferase
MSRRIETPGTSPYDTIARLYDPWSRSVTEDVGFYVAEARKTGGPVVELRLGDLRRLPLEEPVPLIICPFRSYLHLADDGERVEALTAARAALRPKGRLVFDVFAPKPDDIAETHGQWLEREPGIYERADWDESARTLTLSVRGPSGAATMALSWISQEEWQQLLEETGFSVEACYGWFDRSAYRSGEDMIFVARTV